MRNWKDAYHRAGFILKGFPSFLRSSGSKDTLKGIQPRRKKATEFR
jgi:hypothetical protein